MLQQHLNIIVPTLNEAANIERCLLSLQNARHAGHVVCVVDGGSVDDTISLATPLADHVVSGPPGRAAQLALGASVAAPGDLWFVHADSVLPYDGWQHVEAALANEEVQWGRFRVRLSGSAKAFRVIEFMINLRVRLTGIATGDQALFVRRSTYDEIGGIPHIPLMEDIAFTRRLRARSWPRSVAATVQTSSRRWESKGVVRTVVLMWWLRLAYFVGVSPARLARWYR